MEPAKKVDELIRILNDANYRYYVMDDPVLQDFEYDRMLRELEELEAAKEDLEVRIANERIAKPKLTEDHLLHFLLKFRVLDMSKQSHRQRLIDTFVNRIYLYDDKLVITFNHKDGAETITLNDIEAALAEAENGSDLVSFAVPKEQMPIRVSAFLFYADGDSNHKIRMSGGHSLVGLGPNHSLQIISQRK